MLVCTKRNGDVPVKGCGFSDEVIVAVKRNAEDDEGDPLEEKPFRKRQGVKGEGRNTIKDEEIKVMSTGGLQIPKGNQDVI